MSQIRSPAKIKIIEFIHYYGQGATDPFVFEIDGNKQEAANFVHRMRVELSRLRALVRARGRAPAGFKVMQRSIKQLPSFPPRCRIELEQTNGGAEVAAEVNAIFDTLATGNLIQ